MVMLLVQFEFLPLNIFGVFTLFSLVVFQRKVFSRRQFRTWSISTFWYRFFKNKNAPTNGLGDTTFRSQQTLRACHKLLLDVIVNWGNECEIIAKEKRHKPWSSFPSIYKTWTQKIIKTGSLSAQVSACLSRKEENTAMAFCT